jgi:hypothetical protein
MRLPRRRRPVSLVKDPAVEWVSLLRQACRSQHDDDALPFQNVRWQQRVRVRRIIEGS